MLMTYKDNSTFDPAAFLAHADLGRRIIDMKPDQTFFAQGDPADSVFYLQSGKEAKVTLLSAGDFVGEESLSAVLGLRLATATAINACMALRIGRLEMIRVAHQEHRCAADLGLALR